ncbi:hypothetical protein [Herbidospora cretacea]|uniref:hypothetical protein n=1 Tax=Herbidospora cretacea TaxID=28444 RepID=UPI000774B2A6|nr:hypothetical protein [Herbidospora cretacea]
MGSAAAREELIRWQRIRRYAVPRWMIEQATERRLAGDWRGACAAAGVDVLFDLVTVERVHGPATAAALAEDLRHLVPDLLRWHLPRGTGVSGTLAVRRRVTLVRHGAGVLHVVLPERVEAPQRLTLRFGPTSPTSDDWTAVRHLWDARHTAELLERHGGGDPHAERVTALHEQGRVEEAFEAAGLDLELVADGRYLKGTHHLDALARLPLNVARLGAEAALLAERGLGRRRRPTPDRADPNRSFRYGSAAARNGTRSPSATARSGSRTATTNSAANARCAHSAASRRDVSWPRWRGPPAGDGCPASCASSGSACSCTSSTATPRRCGSSWTPASTRTSGTATAAACSIC